MLKKDSFDLYSNASAAAGMNGKMVRQRHRIFRHKLQIHIRFTLSSHRWIRVISVLLFLFLCAFLTYSAITGRAVSVWLTAAIVSASAALALLAESGKGPAVLAAAMGAAVIFLSIIPASIFKEPLYRFVYGAEAVFTDNGNADALHPSGEINRGNLYPSEQTIVSVYTDWQPTEAMYLKNFTGGSYEDGVWESADDVENSILDNIFPRFSRWSSWSKSAFQIMYLLANSTIDIYGNTIRQHALMITDDSGRNLHFRDVPIPYYSTLIYRNSSESTSSVYRYLERSEITESLDQQENNRSGTSPDSADTATGSSYDYFESYRQWLLPWASSMESEYMKGLDAYTEVSRDSLPFLQAYVENHPARTEEEAIQSVLSLLSGQEYSLTPGHVPYGEDPIEYFIRDSHLGYCQQFAGTAVLLLRMYGVPTRYAAGYRLDPEDFTYDETEDGMTLRADISEENAHAWPEIFVKDHGWIPLEVTPDADGLIQAEIPGKAALTYAPGIPSASSGDPYDDIYRLPDLRISFLSSEETSDFSKEAADSTDHSAGSDSGILYILGFVGRILAGIGTFLVLLLPIFIPIRKKNHADRIRHFNESELALLTMKKLQKRGLPRNYTGQESDFPAKVSSILEKTANTASSKEPDQAVGQKLQQILLSLSFGHKKSQEDNTAFLRTMLKKLN